MLSALRGTSRFFALLYIVATVSVGIPDALGQSAPTLIVPYTISTIAGGGSALALDNPGDLYFDDGTHATIRKISSASFAPTMVGASGNPVSSCMLRQERHPFRRALLRIRILRGEVVVRR